LKRLDPEIIDPVGFRREVASLAPALIPGSEIDLDERADRLTAIEEKLKETTAKMLASCPGSQWQITAQRLQASVLECVSALNQLQQTMTAELARRHQLELEVFDGHAALTQARCELAELRACQEQAMRTALHDDLTSLPNRRFFLERLDRELALGPSGVRPLAVLYLDLDGFGPLNQQHGREAGDEVLRIVAMRLRRAIRSEDVLSRVGDDEFACLFAGLPSRVQLVHLACKLLDKICAPVRLGTVRLNVRPSIGIATFPDDGITSEALLERAETAMCRAKRQKSGHAFFDDRPEPWLGDVHAA
jgi:diguanylate cyclase (GGDEF)-like protein